MTPERAHEIVVRTTAELTDLWSGLVGGGTFGTRSLWMIFFHPDGRPHPTVSPIDDVPDEPEDMLLGNLASVLAEVISAGHGTVAFLLSRPGPGRPTDGDYRWGRALRAALPHEQSPWPVHLGTGGGVQVLAPEKVLT